MTSPQILSVLLVLTCYMDIIFQFLVLLFLNQYKKTVLKKAAKAVRHNTQKSGNSSTQV